MDKIVVFKSQKKQPWCWRIVASNGNKLLTSEGYPTKRLALKSARNFCKRHNLLGEATWEFHSGDGPREYL